MWNIKAGSGFTVFVLFFGLALLEAVRSHDWLRATLFLALGLVFLWAERMRPHSR